jgi:thioredoxin-like negative regulator of GroEL
MQGDFTGAVENLRFAVECLPMDLDVQTDLATALNQAGKKVEAKLVLQRILGTGREFRRREGAQKLLASLTPKEK